MAASERVSCASFFHFLLFTSGKCFMLKLLFMSACPVSSPWLWLSLQQSSRGQKYTSHITRSYRNQLTFSSLTDTRVKTPWLWLCNQMGPLRIFSPSPGCNRVTLFSFWKDVPLPLIFNYMATHLACIAVVCHGNINPVDLYGNVGFNRLNGSAFNLAFSSMWSTRRLNLVNQ